MDLEAAAVLPNFLPFGFRRFMVIACHICRLSYLVVAARGLLEDRGHLWLLDLGPISIVSFGGGLCSAVDVRE